MYSASVIVVSWLGLCTSAQPGASSMKAQTGSPAALDSKSPAALRQDIEQLYIKQQWEAARAALGDALRSPNLTPAERAQYHILEGLLDMEAFKETAALKAFGEALTIDPNVSLPQFAAPKAGLFFGQIKALMQPRPPLPPPPTPLVTPPPIDSPTAAPPLRSWAWAPVAGGVVAGGFGFMLTAQARASYDRLVARDCSITSVEQLDATVSAGKTTQSLGVALIGIGVVGLASGAAMYFIDLPAAKHLTIQPTKTGAALTISGVIP